MIHPEGFSAASLRFFERQSFGKLGKLFTGLQICAWNADGRFQKPVAGCPISYNILEYFTAYLRYVTIFHNILQYLTADMRLEYRWEIPEASCRLPNNLHWSGIAGYCPIAAVDAQVFNAMNS